MAVVHMMIGVPGSGKSTYAKENFSKSCVFVSPDEIRKELYGDISEQGNGKEVFAEVDRRIKRALDANYDVVYDATNTHHRLLTIKKFREMGATEVFGTYMNTPFSICLKRNENRTDRSNPVPFDVMERMYENMIRNESSLFSDGFDEVLVINYKAK